jgi:ABC-2 type transport system permease protein
MLKKIFNIAINLLKITLRDKGALVWLLVMPLIWTVLIGSMSGPKSSSNNVPVGIINLDNGTYGSNFESYLAKEKDIAIVIKKDETELAQLVKDTKVSVGLIIPQDFSDSLKLNRSVEIKLLKSEKSSSYFIEELIEKVAKRMSIDALSANFALEKLNTLVQVPETLRPEIWERAYKIADAYFEPSPSIAVNYKVLAVEQKEQNLALGMNLSSPGFAAMFVMMGVFFAGAAMVAERHHGTLARLLTTPTSKFSIISGEMLGFFLLGLVQFAILILFGQYVLGVNWGSSPFGVALLTVSYVFAVTGLGTLLSVFVRTSAQAGAFAVLVSMVTSMIGGSWWPIEIAPKFMQSIARFTPQYWAVNGFNKIITRGFGVSSVLSNFYVLIAIACVSLFASVVLFRFE